MRRSWLLCLGTLTTVFFLGSVVLGKAPAKLAGKVYFSETAIKDQSPTALAELFAKSSPKIELKRRSDKRWGATAVAFFKKPAASGPITIWIYDKSDKDSIKAKEPVATKSVDNAKATDVFIYDLDLDPDDGFNKGRTYLFQVGQIISKKDRVYAAGEVLLQ
jgi:hypothetical protein